MSGNSNMSAAQLLKNLRSAGLELHVAGYKLVVKGPLMAMTEELAARIRTHKAELITQLQHGEGDIKPPSLFDAIDDTVVARAYETKATLIGRKPPVQDVEELQAWLSTIDWTKGVRCGLGG